MTRGCRCCSSSGASSPGCVICALPALWFSMDLPGSRFSALWKSFPKGSCLCQGNHPCGFSPLPVQRVQANKGESRRAELQQSLGMPGVPSCCHSADNDTFQPLSLSPGSLCQAGRRCRHRLWAPLTPHFAPHSPHHSRHCLRGGFSSGSCLGTICIPSALGMRTVSPW